MEFIHSRFEVLMDYSLGGFSTPKTDLKNKSQASHAKTVQVNGTTSVTALALFLTQCQSKEFNSAPHLILVADDVVATRLANTIEFFDSFRRVFTLSTLDASPYSELIPSPEIRFERLHFLYHAMNARAGDIFICPVNALSQLVIPFSEFAKRTHEYEVGTEMPENLAIYFNELGYEPAPIVEDPGQYTIRGGIVDVFSPVFTHPVRIELFGNQIESLRFFDVDEHTSVEELRKLVVIPAKEALYDHDHHEDRVARFRKSLQDRDVKASESDELLRSLVLQQNFVELEHLTSYFFEKLNSPLEYFSSDLNIFYLDPTELSQVNDSFMGELKAEYDSSIHKPIRPELNQIVRALEHFEFTTDSKKIYLSNLEWLDERFDPDHKFDYKTFSVAEFTNISHSAPPGSNEWNAAASAKIEHWKAEGYSVFISTKGKLSREKVSHLLKDLGFQVQSVEPNEYNWQTWQHEQQNKNSLLHAIPRSLAESVRLDEEKIIFLRDLDFLGKKERLRDATSESNLQKAARRLSFGDLKPGDLVVHVKHGIGRYEGLKVMKIDNADAEFLQIGYKETDRLYLPVYKVGMLQRFSGAAQTTILDKLGGTAWAKTKAKVKNHLKDIAAELLTLYAKRKEAVRPEFEILESDRRAFDADFPYEETEDQLRAVSEIVKDFRSPHPMDRLICGDVGFGKTEIAMRAAFFAVQNKKQVCVLAPTTVLTFQHLETFRKRFAHWPVRIECLNRFVTPADAKKTTAELKEGKVQILIGTHRLLSKDIVFNDLGLLIIDEEQKFGVTHKERIRKMKVSVDTIAMSATPIPRTLNMSLMGIRDISFINTAPVDRLPTRTFVCKFNDETIRKAVQNEIKRGGQIYFVHNRIQSIFGVADEVRRIVPEARIKVAHGQMPEHELEKAMLAFFNHEIDILISTAIIESGMDIPKANTMFIDSAHLFGLSQLYQLRGRVGRSKLRAYCYLMMPANKKIEKDAQERLKVIQEHSHLGSGIRIAQYDLEMRGAGTILGDEQSGHVDSVGFELYMDLLAESLAEAKGESFEEPDLDPEINLRIPALIPDTYIQDVRLRLSYYKALADLRTPDDATHIENEMRDQFGDVPEPVINLIGLMLIRLQCRQLSIQDISAGLKTISLLFTPRTLLKPEIIVGLATRENKKYSITPDNRLNVRMNTISWIAVHDELRYLMGFC